MSTSLFSMLASIKNGQMAKKNSIFVKKTKMCQVVLKSLWDEGYILGYFSSTEFPDKLTVFLKYDKYGFPSINSTGSISKPGKRIYLSSKQLWKLDSSNMFVLLSTNQGIKSLFECKRLNIGGEPLFYIK